jgi:hypothetical protein
MGEPLEQLLEEKVEGEHAVFLHMSCPSPFTFNTVKTTATPRRDSPFLFLENSQEGYVIKERYVLK